MRMAIIGRTRNIIFMYEFWMYFMTGGKASEDIMSAPRAGSAAFYNGVHAILDRNNDTNRVLPYFIAMDGSAHNRQ